MDQFEKIKKIGEGSFGKALLVKSKATGEYRVVKEIGISKMNRKEREESKKEVKVLARMRHPNIVSYLESFEDHGNLYIVMEFCDGGDLYKVINKQRGVLFDEDKVLDWLVQLCLALKHVHDRKILHRDIKSQNIFLTRRGIVKLGDFGIAKVLNSTVELARTCIGTPYYLSPEICENRPYNNKSDIWALGCVLYELCTLKHAFEAGNMKNLVLKIIRGSFPPVSPKYSYELRNLQAQLFKRNPRDRPSITTILKKPFLQKRIEQFLSDAQISDEFSHTVLHRNRPALAARPPVQAVARKPPSNQLRISDPAAKYGVPLARRPVPAAAKRQPIRRSGDNRPKKPPSVPNDSKELERKKKELIEKENARQEKDRQIRQHHIQLLEKQRKARIDKAKEEGGWRNLLDSGSSGGSGGGGGGGGSGSSAGNNNRNGAAPRLDARPDQVPPKERGNYDHYHQFLDDLRKGKHPQQAIGREGWPDKNAVQKEIQRRPVSASGANAAKRGEADSVVGAQAAERGRVIEEYLMRKRQAAVNKARGDAQMGWISPAPVASPSGQPPMKRENLGGDCPAALGGRDVAEREYLSRLRAIRLNNFNERRQIEERKARQGVNVRRSIEGAPQDNADVRKKKIEALRAQADDRAARLKEDLERQRREAYEKEKKSWEDHLAKKGFKQHGPKVEKPKVFEKPQAAERRPVPRAPIRTPAVPVVPMTAAFKEAGIQLPGVADEKPAQPSEVPQRGNETKSPVQQRKDEILKKLNEKIPPDRKKWSQSDEPAAVGPAPFANMTLEQTASVMEATGAGDVVVKNPDMGAVLGGVEAAAAPIPGPRKKWTTPGSTVVNVLQKAAISETITIGKQEIDAATKPEDRALGVTVVKDKPVIASKPINKGTIVIEKSPSPAKGQTIVVKSTIVEDEAGEVEETLEVPNDKKMDTEDVPATKDAWSKTTDKKDEAKTEKDQKKLDDKQGEDKDKKDDKEEMSSSRAAVRTDSTDSNNKSNSRRGLTSPDGDASNNIDISIPKTPTNSPAEGGSLKSLSISPMMSPRSPVKAENVLVDGGSSDNDSVEYVLARESSIDIEREKQALEEELEKALMDQVELDDVDEDEEVNDDNNQLYQTASAGVVLGLQTGFFDADVKLLRTCSEPDLCKLFRTNIALNPFFEAEKQKNDLDLEDIEDEDDEDEDDAVEESENDMKEGKSADVDEDKEDGGEDEDDMESIRKSYQHLLEEGDDDDEDGVVTDNGTEELDSTEELQTFIRKSTNKSMEGSDTLTANGKDNEARKDNEDRKTSGIGDSIEDDDDVDDDDDLEGAIGGDPEVVANWDSGSGESDDEEMHSDDDNESVFSMLEESRARLETELGCDQFMKAYKSIAAIHEDEDENIEDGFKIVSGILGREKEYLYPKILQLVMADGAFIEDND